MLLKETIACSVFNFLIKGYFFSLGENSILSVLAGAGGLPHLDLSSNGKNSFSRSLIITKYIMNKNLCKYLQYSWQIFVVFTQSKRTIPVWK